MAPDGRDVVDLVRATGYILTDRRWLVVENLSWGTGDLATPASIVAAWMNSTGHRENILRADYREIGFGVVLGNPRSTDGAGATYTTNFGAVSSEEPAESQPIAATRDDDRRAAARRRARAQRRARAARRARAHRRARAARRARLSRAKGPSARIALGQRARRR